MVYEDATNLCFSAANLPEVCLQGVRVAVKAKLANGQGFVEIGETEIVEHNTDPTFTQTIPITARFDLDQRLRFELHLINMDGSCTPIGRAHEIGLRTIINSVSETLLPIDPMPNKPLWELDESPLLGVEARHQDASTNGTLLQFHATNLHSDHVAQLSAYFTLSLIPNSIEKYPTLLYRSETVPNSTHPKWREFTVPTKYMSTASHQVLEFACYAFRYNHKSDVLLGKTTCTFTQLLNGSVSKFMLHAAGQSKKEHTYVELLKFERVPKVPSYFEAIKGGMKLHFTIAIDFSAKNGGPNDPSSLHFVHPNIQNPYAEALKDIAEAVCPYDSQNRVSLIGFGAKVPPAFELSQSFPLNGNNANPYVRGVDNILSTYRRSSMNVLPYAPIDYSAIIHDVIKMAKVARKNNTNVYFVVIVLSNGYIKQIEDTKNVIVQASELPISVLFSGISNTAHPVGDGDHSRLTQFLDPALKSTTNQPLRRQCTSFVEHEKSEGNAATRELLSIVPMQITQWLML
jgi:hypothetical protein